MKDENIEIPEELGYINPKRYKQHHIKKQNIAYVSYKFIKDE